MLCTPRDFTAATSFAPIGDISLTFDAIIRLVERLRQRVSPCRRCEVQRRAKTAAWRAQSTARQEVATVAALLMGPDGGFIMGSDILMDGGVTASYWYGDLAPQ